MVTVCPPSHKSLERISSISTTCCCDGQHRQTLSDLPCPMLLALHLTRCPCFNEHHLCGYVRPQHESSKLADFSKFGQCLKRHSVMLSCVFFVPPWVRGESIMNFLLMNAHLQLSLHPVLGKHIHVPFTHTQQRWNGLVRSIHPGNLGPLPKTYLWKLPSSLLGSTGTSIWLESLSKTEVFFLLDTNKKLVWFFAVTFISQVTQQSWFSYHPQWAWCCPLLWRCHLWWRSPRHKFRHQRE